ncbi:hypothetical protein [Nostoc sp.]|uniref:hypothetical protein n=1 Tax=Nostoc sp. TaxID=1180 RepID=UPI002FF83132
MMKLIIKLGTFKKISSEIEFIDLPKNAIYNSCAEFLSINFLARSRLRSQTNVQEVLQIN